MCNYSLIEIETMLVAYFLSANALYLHCHEMRRPASHNCGSHRKQYQHNLQHKQIKLHSQKEMCESYSWTEINDYPWVTLIIKASSYVQNEMCYLKKE